MPSCAARGAAETGSLAGTRPARHNPSVPLQGTSLAAVPGALHCTTPAPMPDGSRSRPVLALWAPPCPTHPVLVGAAWDPLDWLSWVLSRQPWSPAGSTAVHQGQVPQRPHCHAGIELFISRGRRKEEEPCALHAKAMLWPPAAKQGHGQTKKQLSATRMPKPTPQGHLETARHVSRTRDAVGSTLPAPHSHARHLEAWRRGQAVLGGAPAMQADGQALPPPFELGEQAGDELSKSH